MLATNTLATIQARQLLSSGDRVAVAVSGGPDSMALLEALAELRERLGLWLCVAHLNHGLRGRLAEEDAEFVAARARALGLPFRLGSADVAALRRRRGGSVEMAARDARYAFLEEVAAEVGATRVALGHTADDQVETVLQRLLRGGELGALRGMPVARPLSPRSSAWVVRPLLWATRAEVLEYLAQRGVGWRYDASNADLSFQRNWVRHELLPLLEARCGGELRAWVLGLTERAAELARAVEREATGLVAERGNEATVDVARAAGLPRLVRRAAARRAYGLAGGRGELAWRTLDAVEGLLEGDSGREVALAGGMVVERSYGELRFRRPRGRRPRVRVALDVPGRVEAPEVGLWVEAEEFPISDFRFPIADSALRGCGRLEELVDLEAVGERLVVRTREAGDRFTPLGLGAGKKLKDFLMDERVPREERERTLLVAGRCGIVWVVGLRLDERAKVTPATRRLARLRAGRLRG
jgi:tRNA(Ile)-lysidine synthase